jgi:alpha-glucosidase
VSFFCTYACRLLNLLARISIAELLEFSALFQIPMVGSDVCGFAGNTTETLCARWATLGAFSPFYRNHNADGSIYQEFYRWPMVAEAAKNAIDARYRLLDYIYTAMYHQTQDGTPLIHPLYFQYPEDVETFPIQYQYFYGDALLVSPVTQENATSVEIYLPKDIFYDFFTGQKIQGEGKWLTLDDIPYTSIPLHVRGGSILPLRITSANTTTELRKKNFNIIIAPDSDGTASGSLYLDEGDAIEQPKVSVISFSYQHGKLNMTGSFGYEIDVVIERITLFGGNQTVGGISDAKAKTETMKTTTVSVGLRQGFEIDI